MSRRDRLEQMPLYQKALQILKITMGLVEIVPKDNEYLQETTVRFMMENAMLLAPKIAGASAIDLYDLKMENATLVRKAARDLYVQAGSLRYEETIPDQDYIRLLRSEIEEGMILWGKNRLLSTFLADLATALSDQQLPQLLQQASHYFYLLTNQSYQQVKLDEGILTVVASNGTQPIYQLSTGTKDQLIMALRFAYLALQREKILSPVIIDDGWLHYDGTRKRQLARLLAEFGQDYQIICLSSDQEMVSYYQEYQQVVKMME